MDIENKKDDYRQFDLIANLLIRLRRACNENVIGYTADIGGVIEEVRLSTEQNLKLCGSINDVRDRTSEVDDVLLNYEQTNDYAIILKRRKKNESN